MTRSIRIRARTLWQRSGEAGQGLAEYALILTFVALACVVAVGALGDAIVSSPGWRIFG